MAKQHSKAQSEISRWDIKTRGEIARRSDRNAMAMAKEGKSSNRKEKEKGMKQKEKEKKMRGNKKKKKTLKKEGRGK